FVETNESTKQPNIKLVSVKKFSKIVRNTDDPTSLLHFFDNSTTEFINSFSTDTPPPEPPPKTSDFDYKSFIPKKYMDWAETVFNPSEFEKLPQHRPFDIDIELEEG
ncbi:hypothetical protein F5050DRAFT_1538498, partial [Lentinula boryana]